MKWQPKTRKRDKRLFGDYLYDVARWHKQKGICAKCRQSWSQRWGKTRNENNGLSKCPKCGGVLEYVYHTKTPRKRNGLAWRSDE